MAEPVAPVVWDRDGCGGDEAALPIPATLVSALTAWGDGCPYDGWMPLHARDHPAVLYEAHAVEGLALAAQVRDALPGWTVVFHDEAKADMHGPHDHDFFEYEPAVAPAAGPAWRLQRFPSLPSTSDACVARAHAGDAAGLAVQAYHQTGGRGSRGRPWHTPEGNLALSVLLRPAGTMADAGLWAFAAAVALRQGLANFTGGLTLKWPNDVLLHGRKVAGVLVETAAAHDRAGFDWLVIGMGANLRAAPPADPASAAPAPAALGAHDPDHVADCVLDRLSTVLRIWRDDGFAAIRRIWLHHAHPIGTVLRVRTGRGDVEGAFAGLTEDGALLLRTPDGVRAFPTGEVLLGC